MIDDDGGAEPASLLAPQWKTEQPLKVRFARYAQLVASKGMDETVQCPGSFKGSAMYGQTGVPLSEPLDPQGATTRAQQNALVEARKRADAYAASMGMKVVRIQRISEVGELSTIFGPELSKDFLQMALFAKSPTDSYLKQDKVAVQKGLFIDFVLGPK